MNTTSRGIWFLPALWALALASLLCFAIPMYVIRPFRAQGTGELAVALFFRQRGPLIAALCALAAVALLIALWSAGGSRRHRALAVTAALAACGFAALNRVNVYELMFHPINGAAFSSAEKTKLDADDMVLAVVENGASRAYPIRNMGYHHIVNDRLGGVPIVATY